LYFTYFILHCEEIDRFTVLVEKKPRICAYCRVSSGHAEQKTDGRDALLKLDKNKTDALLILWCPVWVGSIFVGRPAIK